MASYPLQEMQLGQSAIFRSENPDDAPLSTARWQPESYQLNTRRSRALRDIDFAKFSWFHLKVASVAGIHYFANGYNLCAINIASVMLIALYDPTGTKAPPGSAKDLGLKIAAPIGMFFGSLMFGFFTNVLGRKSFLMLEFITLAFGTLNHALTGMRNDQPIVITRSILSEGNGSPFIMDDANAMSILSSSIYSRFFLGLGVGGDYSRSAIIASEFSPVSSRGRMMTGVIAMQGLGQLTAALIANIAIDMCKNTGTNPTTIDIASVRVIWRILVGLGIVPAVIAFLARTTIPESPRFTMDVQHNIDQAILDIDNFFGKTGTSAPADPDNQTEWLQSSKASQRQGFKEYLKVGKNIRALIGCAFAWFALDFAFYGLSLNPALLSGGSFPGVNSTTCFDSTSLEYDTGCLYNDLHATARRNITVACAGVIPGFYICFLYIDRLGRKEVHRLGCILASIALIVMGLVFEHKTMLLILYCCLNISLNLGPGTTAFMVPAEMFPTRYRAILYGIVAAAGTLGAILSLAISNAILYRKECISGQVICSPDRIFILYTAFINFGYGATLLMPETKGKSLEELSNEDQEDFTK